MISKLYSENKLNQRKKIKSLRKSNKLKQYDPRDKGKREINVDHK